MGQTGRPVCRFEHVDEANLGYLGDGLITLPPMDKSNRMGAAGRFVVEKSW